MKTIRRLAAVCLVLIVISCSIFSVSASADDAPEINIERIMPDGLKAGKEASICLNITAPEDFILGIVEYLPEGWSFPEDDSTISDCPNFELDRENRKISFAADGIYEIHYTVIPGNDVPGEIHGNYVDMLWRNQELDPGKNLWHSIGAAESTADEVSAKADNLSRSNTTLWVIILLAVVVLVLLLGKKFIGKGPQNEK